MLDLGAWASEAYRIPVEDDSQSTDAPPEDTPGAGGRR
jgi:endogenous inhibitor of DNA gyrase (YacG/DUF329 family)